MSGFQATLLGNKQRFLRQKRRLLRALMVAIVPIGGNFCGPGREQIFHVFSDFCSNIYLNPLESLCISGLQGRYMFAKHVPIMYLTYTLTYTSCSFLRRILYIYNKVYDEVHDGYMLGICSNNIYPIQNPFVQRLCIVLRYMLTEKKWRSFWLLRQEQDGG